MSKNVEVKPFNEEGKCSSCGTPWVDHLGIVGTCKALLNLKQRNEELEKLVETAYSIISVAHIGVLPEAQELWIERYHSLKKNK